MSDIRPATPMAQSVLDDTLVASRRPVLRQKVENNAERSFEVELASTGEIVKVRRGQSAVEALREIGVLIPTSCGEGSCGSCLTAVLDGTPLHRDSFLTGDEHAANAQFTPCCSRGVGRLVIDV